MLFSAVRLFAVATIVRIRTHAHTLDSWLQHSGQHRRDRLCRRRYPVDPPRQRPGGRGLPAAPTQPLQLPQSWLDLNTELNNPTTNTAALERLQRIATRLQLCRQAEQAIRNGETSWRAIMGGS